MSAHPISTGEEQRHFECLMTDVSLPFINSSGSHLDTDIETALRRFAILFAWISVPWPVGKATELFVISHPRL